MSLSVTQFGKPLPKKKYTWDKKTKVFSTKEENLLVQCYVEDTTFNTGSSCTFNTGFGCTFTTGHDCIFKTGHSCTFKTGSGCTFKTGRNCTFNTSTSNGCIFKTGSGCTFNTCHRCTFDTGSDCTFTTGDNCVVIRRDTFEIIEIPKETTIKLNNYRIKGFTEIRLTKTIVVDGKTIEISRESFEAFKKQFIN